MRLTLLALVALLAAACGRTEVVRYSELPPDADGVVPPGAGLDAGVDAGPCLPRPLPLEPATPNVMFVIDRSGSMAEDLDGRADAGVTRWRVLEASLRSVLPPLDQQVALGALMYPVGGQSCSVPSAVDLSPRTGNAGRLLSLFTTSAPLGGTPTADALDVAATHLRTLRTATSARALILATDGAPNCNAALRNNTCTCTSPPMRNPNCDAPTHCLDETRTVRQLGQHLLVGLPTYVIGLGSQLNQWARTLDAMAVAGGVPRAGVPRYYSITSQAELTDAFQRITAQLTRCTFLVSGLGLDDPFVVEVGGAVVPEGPDGWAWVDRENGELTLKGSACDAAAMGALARVLVGCR